MKTIARVLIVLALLAALLPAGGAKAEALPADPTCAGIAMAKGLAFESIVLEGSVTCTIYPPEMYWNGDVVMFAHGYMDAREAVGIPWGQIIQSDELNLVTLVISQGFAFSTTSYSKTGLAIKEGVDDVKRLAVHLYETNPMVNRIFLTGASEGGAVTALALEKWPQFFAAGLSTCGPIGSFADQVQYWGNFRVAFDQKFPFALLMPGMLPPPYGPLPYGASTPIYISPDVVAGWEFIRDTYILPMVAANPGAVEDLITEAGVPIDPANPVITAWLSISELLYYNVQATNDGRTTLVKQADILPPSMEGNPLSLPALGITPDKKALKEIEKYYETTGDLKRPLVVMHTTGDPVIPVSQMATYAAKVAAQGKSEMLAVVPPIVRYGHCAFEPDEILYGFMLMVSMTP